MVLAYIGIIVLLAFLAESMTEYVFGQVVDHVPSLDRYRWLLMYIAAAVGVGLAFFYQLDLIHLLAEAVEVELPTAYPGMILTGLGIGRGANYIHQLVSEYFPIKKQ